MTDFSKVKQIIIPEGVVKQILSDNVVLWQYYDIYATPYNGSEIGSMTIHRIDVSQGDKIIIEYYITKQQGYVYDAENVV